MFKPGDRIRSSPAALRSIHWLRPAPVGRVLSSSTSRGGAELLRVRWDGGDGRVSTIRAAAVDLLPH